MSNRPNTIGQPATAGDTIPKSARIKQGIITAIAFILPLAGFINLEVLPRMGVFIYSETYTMAFVGFCVFLLYLNNPLRKQDKGKFALWDVVPGLIVLAGSLYIAINWENIYVQGSISSSLPQQILGWLMILFVAEAARRSVGWPMVTVVIVFLVYTLFGNNITGFLRTSAFKSSNIIGYVYLSNQGIYGMPSEIVATMVLAFVTFGCFLSASKAGDFFLKLALAVMGRLRGGAAKVAILCSCLFSTMTGEPISNIGIVGPMTFPLMKKLNYDPVFGAATVSVASCGSMITPPVMAAVAFLMGQLTNLGYPTIAIAAIIPALLYYIAVYFQIDFYAAKNNYKPIPKDDIPKLKDVFKEGWHYLIPIVLLVIFLLVLRYNPSSSVYYALISLVVISLIKKSDREYMLSNIKKALVETGMSMIPTMALSAAAGIIMATVTLTGLGLKLSSLLEIISGGNLLFLSVLAGVTIYIMGMGMAPIVSYILMAILVAPAMTNMGIPVLAAHFFILYMSISAFITPPVALAGYVTGVMVGVDGMKVCLKAMRIGIVCYLIPFVSIFEPSLLLIGTPASIVQSIVTATCGVVCLASALEGYMVTYITTVQRIALGCAGLLLFIPGTMTDIVGIVLAAVPVIMQIRCFIHSKKAGITA